MKTYLMGKCQQYSLNAPRNASSIDPIYLCVLISSLKVVESHLLADDKLTEALNSEIAQGVISSEDEAVDWVSGTLLFRRISAHPLYYGMSHHQSGPSAVCSFLTDKCIKSIDQLRKVGAITVKEDGTFLPSAASTVSLNIGSIFDEFVSLLTSKSTS